VGSDDNFYEQLNTKVIGDAPGNAINAQSKDVHLEKANEKVLSAINLVNDATFRSDGGAIPDTQQIHTTTVTDDSRTVAFVPAKGELWSVMNITASRTNITSASGVTLYLNDTVNSVLQTFFYGSSTSADFMLDDDGTWDDFVITYPMELQFKAHTSANWDDCTLQVNMIRVR
jgi:hypothetical protein